MSILNDALIDAKADLCWNHQQEQLKGEAGIDCICGQLLDMIVATREEIAKEILFEYDGDDREVWLTDILKHCSDIARGKK